MRTKERIAGLGRGQSDNLLIKALESGGEIPLPLPFFRLQRPRQVVEETTSKIGLEPFPGLFLATASSQHDRQKWQWGTFGRERAPFHAYMADQTPGGLIAARRLGQHLLSLGVLALVGEAMGQAVVAGARVGVVLAQDAAGDGQRLPEQWLGLRVLAACLEEVGHVVVGGGRVGVVFAQRRGG